MLAGMAAARLLKPPPPPARARWCGNVTVVPRSWESFCAARSSMRSSATAKSNASRTRFATWKATSLDETAIVQTGLFYACLAGRLDKYDALSVFFGLR